MKIRSNIKLIATLGIAPAIGYSAAKADDFNFTAAIDILEALKVQEITSMHFGVIERPENAVKVGMHSSRGNEDKVWNTTATHIDTSSIKTGVYKITGSALKTIGIKATGLNNVPGITWDQMHGAYGSASYSMAMVGSSQ